LAGLRLLAPHLTQENHEKLLAKAAGRTKDEIAEIVAALAPRAGAAADDPPAPRETVTSTRRIAGEGRRTASSAYRAGGRSDVQGTIQHLARVPRRDSRGAGSPAAPHTRRRPRDALPRRARRAGSQSE